MQFNNPIPNFTINIPDSDSKSINVSNTSQRNSAIIIGSNRSYTPTKRIRMTSYTNFIPFVDTNDIEKVQPIDIQLPSIPEKVPLTSRSTARYKNIAEIISNSINQNENKAEITPQKTQNDPFESEDTNEPDTGGLLAENPEIPINDGNVAKFSFFESRNQSKAFAEDSIVAFQPTSEVYSEEELFKLSQNTDMRIQMKEEEYIKEIKSRADFMRKNLNSEVDVNHSELIVLDRIKQSTQGEIYRAFHKDTHKFYAVKMLRANSLKNLASILNELNNLSLIIEAEEDYLIKVIDLQFLEVIREEVDTEHIFTLTTELGIGTLQDFIEFKYKDSQEDIVKEKDLIGMTSSLLRQYVHLRDLSIYYRDINVNSICLSEDMKELRFFDFSNAIACGEETRKDILGNYIFMAPEILEQAKDPKLQGYMSFYPDLYSIGALMLYIVMNLVNRAPPKEDELGVCSKSINVAKNRYPALWDLYLKHLVNPLMPESRESPLGFPECLIKRPNFTGRMAREFRTVLLRKILASDKEVFMNNEALIKYAVKFENVKLLKEIINAVFDCDKSDILFMRKAKKFVQNCLKSFSEGNLWELKIDLYNKMAETIKKTVSDKDPHLSEIYKKIAEVYKKHHNQAKAIEYLEKSKNIDEVSHTQNMNSAMKINLEMAHLYEESHSYDLALGLYNKTRESLSSETFLDNTATFAFLNERVANIHEKQKKYDEAIEEFNKALEKYSLVYGKHDTHMATCHYGLGKIYRELGKNSEALEYFKKHCEIKQETLNCFDKELAEIFTQLGDIISDMANYQEAIDNYEKAIHIYEYYEEDQKIAGLNRKIAKSYSNLNDQEKALEVWTKGCQLIRNTLGDNNRCLAEYLDEMGDFYAQKEDKTNAFKCYTESMGVLVTKLGEKHQLVLKLQEKIIQITLEGETHARKSHRHMPSLSSTLSDLKKKLVSSEDDTVSVVICLKTTSNIKGILEGTSLKTSLGEIRKKIETECRYINISKYCFSLKEGCAESMLENEILLKDILIRKEFVHYLLLEERS